VAHAPVLGVGVAPPPPHQPGDMRPLRFVAAPRPMAAGFVQGNRPPGGPDRVRQVTPSSLGLLMFPEPKMSNPQFGSFGETLSARPSGPPPGPGRPGCHWVRFVAALSRGPRPVNGGLLASCPGSQRLPFAPPAPPARAWGARRHRDGPSPARRSRRHARSGRPRGGVVTVRRGVAGFVWGKRTLIRVSLVLTLLYFHCYDRSSRRLPVPSWAGRGTNVQQKVTIR
jgi:hypothetical protein